MIYYYNSILMKKIQYIIKMNLNKINHLNSFVKNLLILFTNIENN